MTDVNLSAVLYGKDDLRMEERPIPEPAPGHVQIKIHSVGVCGTDVHYWKKGYVCTPDHPILKPRILGHETSGVISKLGAGVVDFKVGERVHLEPSIACLKCEQCKKGRAQLCPTVVLWKPSGGGHYARYTSFRADYLHKVVIEPSISCLRCDFCKAGKLQLCPDVVLTISDGCGHYARYCTQTQDFLHRLPDSLSFEEGALIEPAVVCVYACDRAEVKPGMSVFVVGGGAIGCLTILAAKAAGATKIVVADIVESRVEFAKSVGATCGVVINKGKTEAELVEEVRQHLGDYPESTIDCSGSEGGIRLGLMATKSGGILALAGLAPPECKLPLVSAAVREVDIKPVFKYGHAYKRTIKMMAAGQLDVRPVIGQKYPLEKAPEAMESLMKGTKGKPIVHCFRD